MCREAVKIAVWTFIADNPVLRTFSGCKYPTSAFNFCHCELRTYGSTGTKLTCTNKGPANSSINSLSLADSYSTFFFPGETFVSK